MVTALSLNAVARQTFRSPAFTEKVPGDGSCEFCRELQEDPQTHFRQIYKDSVSSRIVPLSSRFVAVPSIGQLLPRWIMLLPIQHYRCFSEMPSMMQNEAASLIETLGARMSSDGDYLVFEHGCLKSSGSCGVNHAHLHVVPVPFPVRLTNFLWQRYAIANSLPDAFTPLHSSSEYLLLRDGRNTIMYFDATSSSQIGSQFMRKCVAHTFCTNTPHWDWRHYTKPEPHFFDALAHLRETRYVPISF